MKRRPYPHYSFFDLLYSEEQLLAGQKPDIDPSVFKDKIVFVGVTAARFVRRLRNAVRRWADARHSDPRIRCRRFPVEPRHAAGVARRPHRPGYRRSRLSSALIATLLPAWWAAGAFAAIIAAFAFVATRQFAGGNWINHHAADACLFARIVRRRRISVLLRRAREAEDEAALRPVRVKGRLRAARRKPGSCATGRTAAPDDGALFRHPRLHDRVSKRGSRRRSSPSSTSTSRGWSRSCSRTRARSTSSSATW